VRETGAVRGFPAKLLCAKSARRAIG